MEPITTVPKPLRYKKRQRQLKKRRRAANRRRNSQSTAQSCESQNNENMTSMWNNAFNGVISWQYQHQIAYWKSKAIALSYENKVLHTIVKDLYKNKSLSETFEPYEASTYKQNERRKKKSKNKSNDHDDAEEYDFVLSEEMVAFLQKSAEHRLQRDQEKKKLQETIEAEKCAPPLESADSRRHKSRKILYGSNVDKIICLETCLQLNFDNYIDSNNPVHWPNIPLVL